MTKSDHSKRRRRKPSAAASRVATTARRPAGSVARALRTKRPTAAMFKPVEALVAFIATLPGGAQPTMFAPRGVTILENFAPFVFVGIDAVVQWERGFRRHSVEGALTELAVAFGRAQDFSVTRGRAFFVLPATWTGRAAGRLFDEKGAWSFLLARAGAGWKILGYGWGVTSKETRSRSRRA